MKLIIAGMVLFLIAGCAPNYDAFAQCLSDEEVKMYGTEWCPHCKNQKAAFGDSFKFVTYIDCDKNTQACADNDVTGYPTWISGEVRMSGEQPLERLAQVSGCQLG